MANDVIDAGEGPRFRTDGCDVYIDGSCLDAQLSGTTGWAAVQLHGAQATRCAGLTPGQLGQPSGAGEQHSYSRASTQMDGQGLWTDNQWVSSLAHRPRETFTGVHGFMGWQWRGPAREHEVIWMRAHQAEDTADVAETQRQGNAVANSVARHFTQHHRKPQAQRDY